MYALLRGSMSDDELEDRVRQEKLKLSEKTKLVQYPAKVVYDFMGIQPNVHAPQNLKELYPEEPDDDIA